MSSGSEVVRMAALASLNEDDLGKLSKIAGPQRTFARGEALHREGDSPPGLFLLLSGWTASSVTLENGGRQLLKVHMPGDMLGLPSLAFKAAVDTLVALSDAEVRVIAPAAIGKLFEHAPRLAAIMFLISQEERAMLMDRLTAMGRTDAATRVAAIILQLHARLLRNDPEAGDTFRIPLTQNDLADLAGVTLVHVNRVLQQMREDKLVDWRRQAITILDRDGLRRLAQLPQRELDREPAWLPARR